MELNEYRVIPTVILPMIPLWILPQPKKYLFLLEARQDKNQELLEAELTKQYIGIKYEQYVQVFTDASKNPQNGQVGVCYSKVESVWGEKNIKLCVSVYRRVASNFDSNE